MVVMRYLDILQSDQVKPSSDELSDLGTTKQETKDVYLELSSFTTHIDVLRMLIRASSVSKKIENRPREFYAKGNSTYFN